MFFLALKPEVRMRSTAVRVDSPVRPSRVRPATSVLWCLRVGWCVVVDIITRRRSSSSLLPRCALRAVSGY